MNSNDALVGALVAWTLAVLSFPAARGAMLAAAGLTKFAPLALIPLFGSLKNKLATLVGFAVAALLLLSMLALDADGAKLFWDRTVDYQLGRVTPMSVWTLGTYHPGWWDLRPVQHIFQIAAAIGVLGLAAFPRHRKDAAAVAAFAAAVVLVAQMLASYWFYPYVCWWLPAVMIALFVPRAASAAVVEAPIPQS